MSMFEKPGIVRPATFLVLCPECGASVSNPDTGHRINTIETLEQVEGQRDTSNCHMCHECGTSFQIHVSEALRRSAVRYNEKAAQEV